MEKVRLILAKDVNKEEINNLRPINLFQNKYTLEVKQFFKCNNAKKTGAQTTLYLENNIFKVIMPW